MSKCSERSIIQPDVAILLLHPAAAASFSTTATKSTTTNTTDATFSAANGKYSAATCAKPAAVSTDNLWSAATTLTVSSTVLSAAVQTATAY